MEPEQIYMQETLHLLTIVERIAVKKEQYLYQLEQSQDEIFQTF